MNFESIFKEATEQGRLAAFLNAGENVMIFPCGFAWVKISQKMPNSKAFVNWLKEKGIGFKSPLGGYDIWISDYNQSMLHKESHADAMAAYLRSVGIDANAGSKID
jgi:hypothetical protein